MRPTAPMYLSGAVANGGIVAIWLASRTTGVPIGPEPWTAEPAGFADVVATLLEFVVAASSLILLRAERDRRRSVCSNGPAGSVT